jgi:hypothetical protein
LTRLLLWYIIIVKPAIFAWLRVVAVDDEGIAAEHFATPSCMALRALRTSGADEVLSYLLLAALLYRVAHAVDEAAIWLGTHTRDNALPSWLVLTSASAGLHIHDLLQSEACNFLDLSSLGSSGCGRLCNRTGSIVAAADAARRQFRQHHIVASFSILLRNVSIAVVVLCRQLKLLRAEQLLLALICVLHQPSITYKSKRGRESLNFFQAQFRTRWEAC